jgi:hypothetical protein
VFGLLAGPARSGEQNSTDWIVAHRNTARLASDGLRCLAARWHPAPDGDTLHVDYGAADTIIALATGMLTPGARRGGGDFDRDDLEVLEVVVRHASMALENAYLIAELQQRIIEAEMPDQTPVSCEGKPFENRARPAPTFIGATTVRRLRQR